MRASWGYRIVAAAGLSLLSACAAAQVPAKPGSPLTSQELRDDPCRAYTAKSMQRVLAGTLKRAGWPQVTGNPPTSRIAANVQRCLYQFSPKDSRRDGDQSLRVYIYNELDNGAKLMAACRTRPLRGAPMSTIGDESCIDDSGELRFRVGDSYVAVLIDVPPRLQSGNRVLNASDTSTFTAPSRPTDLAALALPVARDLAERLH
ncbi:hypothetical protein HC031_01190 [Planosporangium thailandense]|uniref:DUF3558 domain-containing protein n=1 Tax=Planosporangium thailandense TaxID=765197 RepID=A0ABX0XQT6_9ACTN|nr:hypothetical protein [Planosporangium thailandense]NJC68341.1 hypothetical protein [Planosporangium thailandense]